MPNSSMDHSSPLRPHLDRWRLRLDGRLDGGFRSQVAACSMPTGTEVVLKLTVSPAEAEREAATLRLWHETGAAVRLLGADVEHGALLLERIRPGTPLPGGDEGTAVAVAAKVLHRLQRAPPGHHAFPPLQERYVEDELRAREDATYEQRTRGDRTLGLAGLQRLEAARSVATRLCATTSHSLLLHGDFLDKNLLWNGSAYLAIDPMPYIGDPCSEIGMFAAEHPPAHAILLRAAALATRMGYDVRRAQQWAAVWTVLLTASAWREDEADLATCLASHPFERLLSP